MPFNIGGSEFIVICVIALLVFGPGELPRLMRDAGRLWRKVKTATDEMRSEFNKAMVELEIENPVKDPEPSVHPGGYDPATHSIPYVPPVFPEAIEVGNNAHLALPDPGGVIEVLPEPAKPAQDEAQTLLFPESAIEEASTR